MSRRREEEPLTKVTVSLFTADVERLRALYADQSYNAVLRRLLRLHILAVDAKAERIIDVG